MAKKVEKRVQVTGVHGRRVNMRFPSSTLKRDLEAFKTTAMRMVQCCRANLPYSQHDISYVLQRGEGVRRRIKLLGIPLGHDDQGESKVTLGAFLSRFTATKRGEAERKTVAAARRLERFFDASRDIREITKTDAEGFRNWLVESEKLRETSTVRRTIGYASSAFAAAVEDGVIAANPFRGLPKTVQPNLERWHYIDAEETRRIWAAIKTLDDQVRFVLLRYLGLRAPSELDALTWRDFDWGTQMVRIRAAKLRHHASQGIRWCPFSHPDVLPVIHRAYDARESDDAPVVPRIKAPTLRRRAIRWLGQAGVELWEQLFINFRRSAVTDAHKVLPSHVVSAYFGHSEIISRTNYAMETSDHRRAFSSAPSILDPARLPEKISAVVSANPSSWESNTLRNNKQAEGQVAHARSGEEECEERGTPILLGTTYSTLPSGLEGSNGPFF